MLDFRSAFKKAAKDWKERNMIAGFGAGSFEELRLFQGRDQGATEIVNIVLDLLKGNEDNEYADD